MHKLVSLATVAIIATSISSAASAGEVTGGPKHKATGMRGHAQSICGFSGQEDGFALAVDEFGNPILDEFGQMTFIEVEFGPGTVQTPSHESSPGYIHAPGIPGTACRGNLL